MFCEGCEGAKTVTVETLKNPTHIKLTQSIPSRLNFKEGVVMDHAFAIIVIACLAGLITKRYLSSNRMVAISEVRMPNIKSTLDIFGIFLLSNYKVNL